VLAIALKLVFETSTALVTLPTLPLMFPVRSNVWLADKEYPVLSLLVVTVTPSTTLVTDPPVIVLGL